MNHTPAALHLYTAAFFHLKAWATVALGMACAVAAAQDGQATPEGGVKLDNGVVLYPSLKLSYGHDDNVRASTTEAISASLMTLAAGVKAELQPGGSHRYSLGYDGVFTRYSGTSDDDTNSHSLSATGLHTFSARSRLNWSLGHQEGADARAEAVVESTEPDQWRANSLQALYSYGAAGAQGRIETSYGFNRKRYQNNLDTTAASDVDSHQVAGRYFWRVMPRTYLVAEARLAQTQYRVGTVNDNADTRLLAGATWEATAKTTGSVKVGHQSKRFDEATKADASGLTYEASVDWKPLTYSVVSLTANRAVFEALADGDYDVNTSLGLSWSHQWNAALSSRVSVRNASSKFANSPRRDDTLTTSVGMTYGLSRRYSLGLDLAHTQRDSTKVGNTYKRNTVLVNFSAAL